MLVPGATMQCKHGKTERRGRERAAVLLEAKTTWQWLQGDGTRLHVGAVFRRHLPNAESALCCVVGLSRALLILRSGSSQLRAATPICSAIMSAGADES